MNEQWKRLIEAERRVARLEQTLRRTNTAINGIRGAQQTDAFNVPNPFGSGGGGGGGGMVRFETNYDVWVEWSTAPTLITGASSNVPADGPALAEAVNLLEDGITVSNLNTFTTSWFFDHVENRLFQSARYKWLGLSLYNRETAWKVTKYDGGNFLIDQDEISDGADIDERSLDSTSGDRFYFSARWNRRNGGGSIIGTDTLVAMRTSGSAETFVNGPIYGTRGVWSFAMECPATTYHTSGSGTIYLRWGTAIATPLVAGGTPGSLPTDFIAGGTPGSLPSDFIEGGSY